mmetsp:Transcript_11018/g.27709  ORF Transcript_11018/g.27709 Transcript_11018/m.27709 type:complete len:264 (-) Transcript_11018:629-1420(-)
MAQVLLRLPDLVQLAADLRDVAPHVVVQPLHALHQRRLQRLLRLRQRPQHLRHVHSRLSGALRGRHLIAKDRRVVHAQRAVLRARGPQVAAIAQPIVLAADGQDGGSLGGAQRLGAPPEGVGWGRVHGQGAVQGVAAARAPVALQHRRLAARAAHEAPLLPLRHDLLAMQQQALGVAVGLHAAVLRHVAAHHKGEVAIVDGRLVRGVGVHVRHAVAQHLMGLAAVQPHADHPAPRHHFQHKLAVLFPDEFIVNWDLRMAAANE